MTDLYHLTDLEMLARDCLTRAGVGDTVARAVARDVALSEAMGDSANGFEALLRDIRLVRYGRIFADARIGVSRLRAAILQVDAGHGFAASALAKGVPELVEMAGSEGIAMIHLTRASDPGAMTGAMLDLAGAGLAAITVRSQGRAHAVRPNGTRLASLEAGAPGLLAAQLSLAPPATDSPLDGPVAQSGWLTALDPGVTAAADLLENLPVPAARRDPGRIALAPDLLAQIVNA